MKKRTEPKGEKTIENEKTDEKATSSRLPGLKYAALVTVIFLAIYFTIFSQFKQIPGPLYGGDLYFHYGIMNHIMNGNLPWTNPQMIGEYAHYPWLGHILAVGAAKVLGADLLTIDLYFPLLIIALGGLAAYLLGKRVFEDDKYVFFFCIAWLGAQAMYGTHPRLLTEVVIMPLFFAAVLYALKKNDLRAAGIAGLGYGLTGVGHGSAFMGASLFIALLFAYYCLAPNMSMGFDAKDVKIRPKADVPGIKAAARKYAPIFFVMTTIGGLISLLYWGPPIFVYHGKTLNPWQDYGFIDYSKYGVETVINTLQSTFFNLNALMAGNFAYFILSALVSTGLYFAAKKRDSLPARFLLVLMLTGLIGALHFVITIPLLHTAIAPSRIAAMVLSPAIYLLFIYGVANIHDIIKTKHREWEGVYLIAILLLLVFMTGTTINNYYNSTWANVGRTQSPMLDTLQDTVNWVEDNTDKNSVFISSNEESFALNALTGRKIVTIRRTHASMYVNMDERAADAAVILYGNDTGKALELAKKYNITYLYWDANWLQNDFHFDEEGRPVDVSDPLMVSPTDEYAKYLTRYGVTITKINTSVDPANRGPKYAKTNMLVVFPARGNPETPWSAGLSEHLTLVHESSAQGYVLARVYRIDYSGG